MAPIHRQDYQFGVANLTTTVVFPVLGGRMRGGRFEKHFSTPISRPFDIQQCRADIKFLPRALYYCSMPIK